MVRMSGQVFVVIVLMRSLPVLMERSVFQRHGYVAESREEDTLTAMMDQTNGKRIVGIVQFLSLPVLMAGSAYQLHGNVIEEVAARMDRMSCQVFVVVVQMR